MSDILTEEQAKTKWCPFARTVQRNDLGRQLGDDGKKPQGLTFTSINRPVQENTHCIASNCLAWRSVWSETAGDARGYCGAFGKPLGV